MRAIGAKVHVRKVHLNVFEAVVFRVERRHSLVRAVAVQDARVFLHGIPLLGVAQRIPTIGTLPSTSLC